MSQKHAVRVAIAATLISTTAMTGLAFGPAAVAASSTTTADSRSYANPGAPTNPRVTYDSSTAYVQVDVPAEPEANARDTIAYDSPHPTFERPNADRVKDQIYAAGLSTNKGASVRQINLSYTRLGLEEGQSRTIYVHTAVRAQAGGAWRNSTAYASLTITRPRTFAASSSYAAATDSFTLTGKTVEPSSSIQVSEDNGSTWHSIGDASNHAYSVELDRKYTSGTSLRVREGNSGSGTAVSLHTAALSDVSVGKNGTKRTLTARASANAEIHVSKSDLAADDYQVLTADSDGWVRNAELDQVPGAAKTATIWSGDQGKRTEVNLPLTLSANATNVNVEKGTANLDGFVPDGTNLVQIKWGTTTKAFAPTAEGTFQYALDKLALGSNPVEITAFKGGVKLGTFELDAELKVENVTAAATFDDENVEKTVELHGAGTPGTKIEIRRGMKVVATETVQSDGSWTGTVNPPNMTGTDTLDVVQVIRGQDNGSIELPVDYGVGTTITSPGDDFELDPGSTLVLTGVSQQNSLLRVYEKGKPAAILGSAAADSDDGGWVMAIDDLEDREYTLVAATTSKGYNRTTTELTINPGKSTVKQPTADVAFDADVTKKAVVSGEGADGATITVKNGTKTLGTTTVRNGEWSLPIDPIGPGKHTLTVEQTGIDGAQTVTTEADYGNALEFTTADGASFSDGTLSVAGKSSQGAKVTISTGGKQVDSFTVDRADGTFTRDITGLGSGPITLTGAADSRGGLHTEDTLTATSPVRVEAITVASHVKGGTFVPGTQVFAGHATAGAAVTMNPFGFDPKYAAYNLTTTADQFGEWSISRGLSDTPYPFISFKQTPQNGVVNDLINYDLKPYREIGQPGDLTLTNFKAGDYFTPGDQIFTGTATPGATVTLNPFGFDPRYAGYNMTTTADETTGQWQIRRGLAAGTLYRDLAVKQDPEAEGKVNRIERIVIAANDWVGAPADLKLTGPGTTFTPGTEQTFTGTATPGVTVTLYPFGDDRYADINMTTKVDATGTWTIKRSLSNQAYPIVITQTEQAGKTNRITNTMTPTS